uniref:CRISPR type III-associated protein domain-containing protein n=1 Tax=Desulfobacca acetoxidans TaxID=60893 RepID=A0A7V4LBY0_9BACT
MSDFVGRYYRRKVWNIEAHILTPLFLGGAQQGAEWRAAPFKSLLRYWWRLTRGPRTPWETLLQDETRLFGSAGEQEGEGGQSLVRVGVVSQSVPQTDALKTDCKIPYPKFHGGVEGLLYLAGIGLLETNCVVKMPRSYFPPGSDFTLEVDCSEKEEAEVKKTFAFIQAFGALGSRCRNGWGSFAVTSGGLSREDAVGYLQQFTHPWEMGFEQDYPTCLGRDDKGPLLWKTGFPRKTWEEAMRDLADAYAGLRARTEGGIGPLDADGKSDPGERHLLGFPLTNHPAESKFNQGWGHDGRHASPLRFVVRRHPTGFVGFVLHVPHRFSDTMTRGIDALEKNNQLAVWGKVHRKLDHLLVRARYEECL